MNHYILAIEAAHSGDLDAAVSHMQAAWRADTSAVEIPRELARFLIDAGRPREAVDPARRAIHLAPDDPESSWLLGWALSRSGQNAEAIPSLLAAWQRDRRNRTYLTALISVFESEGRLQDALDLLTPTKGGVDPDDPYLFARRAGLLGRLGRQVEGLGDLASAVSLSPTYPGLVDHLLALCWRLGPSEATVSALERVLAVAPNRADIRRELARVYLSLNRPDEAMTHLETLMAAGAADGSAQMQLGILYFGRERLAEAIRLFRGARAIDPDLRESAEWLWRSLNRADSLNAALALADTLISASPEVAGHHWLRALSLARLNRPLEALASLDQVLERSPDEREARLMAAALLEDLDRTPEARLHLERLARLAPSDREVLFRLGVLDERSGDIAGSIGWFEQLLRAYPDDALALNYLGYLLADRGLDLEKAVAYTSRAVSLDGKNPAFLDSYGWALFRSGRNADAIPHLEEAARLAPGETEIGIHLAKAYRESGRVGEARKILDQILAREPNERRARELLQLWVE